MKYQAELKRIPKLLAAMLTLVLMGTSLATMAQGVDDDDIDTVAQSVKDKGEKTAESVEVKEGDTSEFDEKIEEVLVTGSRLARTSAELAGNLQVYDAIYIENTGETSLEGFLRRIPQIANSASSTAAGFTDLDGGINVGGMSAANLRGLGTNATLVLLDGRRMGHDGLTGGFSDISSIPIHRIERIEILTDGASAVYGADAVGGVINIILRKGYRGISIGGNYTRPWDGGFNQKSFYVEGGFGWNSGDLSASISYDDNTGMRAGLRGLGLESSYSFGHGYSVGANPLADGSTAIFYTDASGNNITVADWGTLDPADQALYTSVQDATYLPGYASNPDVSNMVAGYESAGVEDGGAVYANTLLIPIKDSKVATLNFRQDLGEKVKMLINLSLVDSSAKVGGTAPSLVGTFHADNPYNLLGVKHSFQQRLIGDQFEDSYYNSETDRLNAHLGFEGNFTSSWDWTFNYSHDASETSAIKSGGIDLDAVNDGLNTDGVTPVLVKDETGPPAPDCTPASWTNWWYCPATEAQNPFDTEWLSSLVPADEFAVSENTLDVVNATIAGDLFDLPAGTVRLLIGAEHQEQEIDSETEYTVDVSSAIGRDPFDSLAKRSVRAAFGELLIPLLSDRAGFKNLLLTTQVRYDDYYRVKAFRNGEPVELEAPGSDTSWGAGLIWDMTDSFRVRLNRQTAFVAPQLKHTFSPETLTSGRGRARVTVHEEDGSTTTVFAPIIRGGNADLMPETSLTDNIGFEFKPGFAEGLTIKASFYDIEYNDKIARPPTSSMAYDPGIQRSDPPSWVTADPETGDPLFIDNRYINTARVDNSGVDFGFTYNKATNIGDFFVDLNFNHVLDYKSLAHETAEEWDKAVGTSTTSGLLPIPKNSYFLAATWSRQGLSATLTHSAKSNTVIETYHRFETEYPKLMNLNFGYDFDQGNLASGRSWAKGLRFSLVLENLTNDFTTSIRTDATTNETTVYTANAYAAVGRGRSITLGFNKEFR